MRGISELDGRWFHMAEDVEHAASEATPPGSFCNAGHGSCHYLYTPCEQASSSEVTLVLVHGFVGSHLYFAELAEHFASRQTVLRYDCYGRGFTPAPDGIRMTTELFVEQLYELLEQLGEKRVDLLGYSMGGAIALSFAAQHPAKVRKLGLVAPAGFPSMRKTLPRWVCYLAGVPGVSAIAGWAVVRAFSKREVYGSEWRCATDNDRQRLRRIHNGELTRLPREQATLAHAATNSLRWFSWGEVAKDLSPFKGPVLVIWGKDDRCSPEAASEAKAILPQAELLILQGQGHAVPLEFPQLIAEAFGALAPTSVSDRM